jgi:hypothetical protein
MAENLILAVWALAWIAAITIAVRVAWWMFLVVVRGTGKAWRGD